MGRPCECCRHPQRTAVEAMLLRGSGTYAVAARFGLSQRSAHRHKTKCLAERIRETQEARMLASSESLIAEMNKLHAYVQRVLERGEMAGNDDLVLRGVSQGQRNVETLAKLGPVSEIEQRIKALERGSSQHGGDQ